MHLMRVPTHRYMERFSLGLVQHFYIRLIQVRTHRYIERTGRNHKPYLNHKPEKRIAAMGPPARVPSLLRRSRYGEV
jgi:hypothetical protein